MNKLTHLDLTFNAWDALNLPKHLSILDIGCGDGTTKDLFAIRGYKNWVGVDRDYDCPNFPIYKSEMQDLKNFVSKSFDVVFVCHSLEHCPRPIDALQEFKRILKDDGFLFLSLPLFCQKQLEESDHIMVMNEYQVLKWLSYVHFGWSMHLYNMNDNCVEQGSQFFLARKKDDWKMINVKCNKCGKEKKAFNYNLISNCCDEKMAVVNE